jgi:hypothetical protein
MLGQYLAMTTISDRPVRDGFFDAHEKLRRLGPVAARRAATSPLERVCVDAAAALSEIPADETRRLFGSLAATCLPYRDPGPDRQVWHRRGGDTHFAVTPGRSGFPFGAKARIMLLHLIDRAIRSGTPAVNMGQSMRGWLVSNDIALGGMSYALVGEQSRRIAGCGLRVVQGNLEDVAGPQPEPEVRAFISGFELETDDGSPIFASPQDAEHTPVFPRCAFLDPGFFRHVLENRVVLDRAALQQISDNGWALDLYIWLASELPSLSEPVRHSWTTIWRDGFADHGPKHRIKAKIIATLPLAAAVYPAARFIVENDGIVLIPSAPAA